MERENGRIHSAGLSMKSQLLLLAILFSIVSGLNVQPTQAQDDCGNGLPQRLEVGDRGCIDADG